MPRRPRTPFVSRIAALLAALALYGCAPSLLVVRQATPNPLKRSTPFEVMGVSFKDARMGPTTEEAWLKSLSPPSARASWEAFERSYAQNFEVGFAREHHGALVEVQVSEGAYQIVPRVLDYTRTGGGVHITLAVDVLDLQGRVTDQIELFDHVINDPEPLAYGARGFGARTADYLLKRTGP